MTLLSAVRRVMLPAALMLAGFALLPQQASAQVASYCDKALVADAVYTTVNSNGSKSRIDYFMQLRNTTSKPVAAHIQFTLNAPPAVFTDRFSKAQTLAHYQSVTLKLASQTVNNPGGQGAVSRDVAAKGVSVVCAVAR